MIYSLRLHVVDMVGRSERVSPLLLKRFKCVLEMSARITHEQY